MVSHVTDASGTGYQVTKVIRLIISLHPLPQKQEVGVVARARQYSKTAVIDLCICVQKHNNSSHFLAHKEFMKCCTNTTASLPCTLFLTGNTSWKTRWHHYWVALLPHNHSAFQIKTLVTIKLTAQRIGRWKLNLLKSLS